MNLHQATCASPPTGWACLPPRMRVLYVSTPQRTGSWLAEALAVDSACEVLLEECTGHNQAMVTLRDQAFDIVLLSHEPGELDALELIEGLRGGGCEDPVIVMGSQSEQEMLPLCCEVGADAYVCASAATTRGLFWLIARALQRHDLMRENRRLAQAERHRLQQEHQEAERLLAEQRGLIDDLKSLQAGESDGPETTPRSGDAAEHAGRSRPLTCALPAAIKAHYRDMLRAHVIMGSGNLAHEMASLADLLATAGVTAQQTMLLHVQVLEELIRGLGNRSARHVMTRADLLVLEVLVHLAEGYRRRYLDRLHPPTQQMLPGF